MFALVGLILIALDFGARANSVAPSMYQSDITGWGVVIVVVCGLISLAAYASAQ